MNYLVVSINRITIKNSSKFCVVLLSLLADPLIKPFNNNKL